MRALGALALSMLLGGCQSGTAANPAAADLNLALGAAYLDQGRLQLAREKLTRAAAQDPGSSEAHRTLGMVYERLGDSGGAEEHYRRALRLAPRDVEALNSLGVFHCRQPGEAERGLELLRRAAMEAGNSRKADIYANCGLCGLSLDRAEAAKWLRQALEIDPRHRRARMLLDRVDMRH